MIGYVYRINDRKIHMYTENKKDITLDNEGLIDVGLYLLDSDRPVKYLGNDLDSFLSKIDLNWTPLFQIPQDMKMHMLEFAKRLLRYKLENRFVLLRSHNDADGFGAAVGIAKIFPWSIKIIYQSPSYNIKDAIYDISVLSNKNNPLLILTDLGGNNQSIEALDLVKSHNIEYMVIDHHPFKSQDKDRYLISWEYDQSGKYTASYLTNELARILGYEHDELMYIGMVGDKSSLIEANDNLKMKAMVIDFLTTFTNDFNFIYNVMTDEKLYKEYLMSTKDKYEQIRDIVRELRYVEIRGIKVYFINAEKMINRIEFQSTGKIASYILETVGEDAVILVYNNSRYTIRVGEGAYNKGINTKIIMDELGNIIQGGGHLKAASFRFHEDNKKIIEGKILDVIRKVLK